MSNFWNGKSIEMVAREYLISSVDELEGLQPMNACGVAENVFGNNTIKHNADDFVADYLSDAIQAIKTVGPDTSLRLSQYEEVANVTLKQAIIQVLSQCDTIKKYEDSYHIWNKADIVDLKEDLEYLELSTKFERAADVRYESLESYAYRFLDHVLKEMDGVSVELSTLASDIPMVKMSEDYALLFIKSNFSESMSLLEKFENSGYKVNFASPSEMMQAILFQKEKEIFADNPFLQDQIEFGESDKIILDLNTIDELRESLKDQSENVRLSQFDELTKKPRALMVNPSSRGVILDMTSSIGRCEILR